MVYTEHLLFFCESGIWYRPGRGCLHDQYLIKTLLSPGSQHLHLWSQLDAGGIKCVAPLRKKSWKIVPGSPRLCPMSPFQLFWFSFVFFYYNRSDAEFCNPPCDWPDCPGG